MEPHTVRATGPAPASEPAAPAPVRPLTLPAIELTSVSILQDALSVHVKTETPRPEAVELLDTIVRVTRGKQVLPVALGAIRFPALIISVTSRRGVTTMLLRTARDPALVGQLFPLVGRKPLRLQLGAGRDPGDPGAAGSGRPAAPDQAPEPHDPLARLLGQAARAEGLSEAALLEALTTFVDRDGRTVPGRRALAELSRKQRVVVRDRLERLLQRAESARPGALR